MLLNIVGAQDGCHHRGWSREKPCSGVVACVCWERRPRPWVPQSGVTFNLFSKEESWLGECIYRLLRPHRPPSEMQRRRNLSSHSVRIYQLQSYHYNKGLVLKLPKWLFKRLEGGPQGTFWGDGNVPCLDLGGVYMKEIHQNLYTTIKANSWGN